MISVYFCFPFLLLLSIALFFDSLSLSLPLSFQIFFFYNAQQTMYQCLVTNIFF
ncbi:hypothetical protein HanRHA438_Chr03g0113331 [Helianthus annuus]|nr:hypothetical protein HanRHA438_Chr03g0113331 [Helianthus annuus]